MANQNAGGSSPNIKVHIGKYLTMLKKKAHYYFDVGEFEEIITHFLEKGKTGQAQHALRYALNLHPDSLALKLKNAHFLIDSHQDEEAERLLRQLYVMQPDEPEIRFLLGCIFSRKGKSDEAELHFNHFIKFAGTNENTLSSVAFIYEQNGDYSKSLKYLEAAYQQNPKNKYVIYDTAFCCERLGEFEKSAEYYKKYLDIVPLSANAWYNYGVVSNTINNKTQAIEAYDFAIAIKPEFVSAHFNKAVILSELGKYDEALFSYSEVVKLEQNNPEALCGLAYCYQRTERFDQAMRLYKKVLAHDPTHPDAIHGVASVYALNGDMLEGLNYVLKGIKENPTDEELHYLAGRIFFDINQLDKAGLYLQKSLTLNPTKLKTWMALADVLEQSAPNQTLDFLLLASETFSDSAKIHFRLAAWFYQHNNEQKFLTTFEKALALDAGMISVLLEYCPNCIENESVASYLQQKKVSI